MYRVYASIKRLILKGDITTQVTFSHFLTAAGRPERNLDI